MTYFLDKLVSALTGALTDASFKIINFFLLPIGLEPGTFTSLFPYAEYYLPVITSLAYIILILIALRQYQKIITGQNFQLEEVDSPIMLTMRIAAAFILITFSLNIFSTIVVRAAEPIRNIAVTTPRGEEVSAFMIDKNNGSSRSWTSVTDAFNVAYDIELSDGNEEKFLAEYGLKYFKDAKVNGKRITKESEVKIAADEDEYWSENGGYEGWREMALEEYEQTKEILESSAFSEKSKKDKCQMRISVNLIRVLTLIPTTWMMVRLLLTLLHRYVLIMVMVLLSPLACAAFPSKATARTFGKCVELFISTLALFYLESALCRICLESYVNLTSSGLRLSGLENWHILFISFVFIAMVHVILNLEQYLSSMLAVAPVGSQLAGELARDARSAVGLGRTALNAGKAAIGGANRIRKTTGKLRKQGEKKLDGIRKKRQAERDRTKLPTVKGNEKIGSGDSKTNGKTPRGNDRKVNGACTQGKDLGKKLDQRSRDGSLMEKEAARRKILEGDGERFRKNLRKLDRNRLHSAAARLKKDGTLHKDMEKILDGEIQRKAINRTSAAAKLKADNVSVDEAGNVRMDLLPDRKAGELYGIHSPVRLEQTTSKEGTALRGSYVRVTSMDNNVSANNFMAEQWGVPSHRTVGVSPALAREQFSRSGFDYGEISKTLELTSQETLGMYQDQKSGKLIFHTGDRDLAAYEICRLKDTKGVRQDLDPIVNRYGKNPSTLIRSE